MESLRELYKIGNGPSSSHTMGPQKAAGIFREKNPQAVRYTVTLYGSLAATGKGHLTDYIIIKTLAPIKTEIIWKPDIFLPYHPNGMDFEAFDSEGGLIDKWRVYSVGGGSIREEGEKTAGVKLYPLTAMNEILKWTSDFGKQFWQYVEENEDDGLRLYLENIWHVMKEAVKRGCETEGSLPGELHLPRKSASFLIKSRNLDSKLGRHGAVFAYALAVSEENAAGGTIVTAPTCGAAGVLPAVLTVMQEIYGFSDDRIIKALATAGLFGNIVKTNGSISGAEVGCQGEVGTACAMASAAACQLLGGTPLQIEYAAEMGLEHHLGMTCDPVAGLVQIPCIERNAVAAARALDCALYAILSDGTHRISFDKVVETMINTGKDLLCSYKETSTGGLARYYIR